MKKNLKKTIGLNEDAYSQIKNYCQKKGLKITWFVEQILLNYINKENEK